MCFKLNVVVCLCCWGYVGVLCLRLVNTAGGLFSSESVFWEGSCLMFFGLRFDCVMVGWFRFWTMWLLRWNYTRCWGVYMGFTSMGLCLLLSSSLLFCLYSWVLYKVFFYGGCSLVDSLIVYGVRIGFRCHNLVWFWGWSLIVLWSGVFSVVRSV